MRSIKVNEIIDTSKINRFHISLIFWSFFILLLDGYDTVIYGASVPILMKEWSLSPVTAGSIGSYMVVGAVIGAFVFGIVGDKIGRKKTMILCTSIFSIFTFLAGLTNGPDLFTICRVIAGIGLGGVMPNVLVLVADYAPKSYRNAMITFVFCGYAVGSIVCSLLSKSIILTMGWKPIYLFAGIPLLFLPIIMKTLPESTKTLLENSREEELKKILQTANPNYQPNTGDVFEKGEVQQSQSNSPLIHLFREGRGFSTILFWISFFSGFVLIYAMNTWLPKLMMQAGFDLGSSLMFMLVLNIGGIFGTVFFGRLTDKYGFKKVLVPLYLVGGVSFIFFGYTQNITFLYLVIFLAGAAMLGGQNIIGAFVTQYYPSVIRTTGVGVAMGFGRIGGIVAPLFVGYLLSMNLSPKWNFFIISLAAFLAVISNWLIQEKYAAYNMDGIQSKESKKNAPVVTEIN